MIALYAAAFVAAATANAFLVVFVADCLSPKTTAATPTRRRAATPVARPLAA